MTHIQKKCQEAPPRRYLVFNAGPLGADPPRGGRSSDDDRAGIYQSGAPLNGTFR